MNRVEFIENVQGIHYPDMLVDFFDHLVALKNVVEDTGKIAVIDAGNNSIEFLIVFNSNESLNNAINIIYDCSNTITIYGRTMTINTNILTDTEVRIKLI